MIPGALSAHVNQMLQHIVMAAGNSPEPLGSLHQSEVQSEVPKSGCACAPVTVVTVGATHELSNWHTPPSRKLGSVQCICPNTISPVSTMQCHTQTTHELNVACQPANPPGATALLYCNIRTTTTTSGRSDVPTSRDTPTCTLNAPQPPRTLDSGALTTYLPVFAKHPQFDD